jgi:hypothetical protein
MANRDGDIDFATFSDEELREAHDGIDRGRYPLNFANLLKQMAARGIVAPSANDAAASEKLMFLRIAILAAMLCAFFHGVYRFPDAPIKACGVGL